MRIFFDTEFTGLHRYTTLISIGLVTEHGDTFYAELSDYDKTQVDNWLRKNVIANLVGGHDNLYKENYKVYGNKSYVSQHLNEWLSNFEDIELVSDVCHYDMVLFIDLFGTAFDLPKNVNPACHDINQDIAKYLSISETEAFDVSREKFLNLSRKEKKANKKHNALDDALVIKRIYNKLSVYNMIESDKRKDDIELSSEEIRCLVCLIGESNDMDFLKRGLTEEDGKALYSLYERCFKIMNLERNNEKA